MLKKKPTCANGKTRPSRLLIANRGEIAIRIAQSARLLGCSTVSIYSEDEQDCLHRQATEESVPLAGRGVSAYLDADQIVGLAVETGCDAIHPGYGFLSESADFALACEDAGITFVGPTPDTLSLFGDKAAARAQAACHDVPIPAGTGEVADLASIRSFFVSLEGRSPIIIKAVSGGGGRGMRVVRDLQELDEAFERCASEADKAFGNSDLYAEEFIEHARHIEVQIVGDGQGNVSHLWERECTLQRRHQKLVEIAPSPWIKAETRQKLLEYSVCLAESVRFRGLGTFEYLVNEASPVPAVFIEANPRLQVEHTVTEEVLGVDLVAQQLRIATGASLSECGLAQDQIREPIGSAIQVRINAERIDDTGQFLPTAGKVSHLRLPTGPGVRVDHALFDGYAHRPVFDSMVAKLIFYSGEGYDSARLKLLQQIESFQAKDLGTNTLFLKALCMREEVARGDISTQFVESEVESIAREMDRLATTKSNNKRGDEISTAPEPEYSLPEIENGVWLTAAMAGVAVSIDVVVGDQVEPGQTVYVLESMKMEHAVDAHVTGKIVDVRVGVGDYVEEDAPVMLVQLDKGADDLVGGHSHKSSRHDPSDWEPSLEELRRRTALMREMGGAERVAKHRSFGKQTVWDRIEMLADSDSFDEILPLVSKVEYENGELKSAIPKVFVSGSCAVDGRQVMVQASDYTVKGGPGPEFAVTGLGQERSAAEMALDWQIPYVRLIDGVGGSVATFEEMGRSYLPDGNVLVEPEVALLDAVPVVSAVMGVAAGLPAVQVCMAHFSVMVKEKSQVFPGGPPVVRAAFGLDLTKEELGGWQMHTQVSGVVDNAVDTEEEAIEQCRRFLSYLPDNRKELPPRLDESDPVDRSLEDLLAIVPHARNKPYDMHEVLELLFDMDSLFEIGPRYGRGRVAALGRIAGLPVGVLANNPLHGGSTGVEEGRKVMRMIELCDLFNLPLIDIADEPGFKVGPEQERLGIERAGAELVRCVTNSRTPWLTIVVGKLFGVGGQCHQRPSGLFRRIVWPTARWGSMHIEGGVSAAYRSEIDGAADPEKKRQEIEARLQSLASPFRTAEATGQEIIDPRVTRKKIAEFVSQAYRVMGTRIR